MSTTLRVVDELICLRGEGEEGLESLGILLPHCFVNAMARSSGVSVWPVSVDEPRTSNSMASWVLERYFALCSSVSLTHIHARGGESDN